MAALVLTAIGDDRAGLVTAMSDVVASHGGNWERSQMAELAGKFAGIVLVTVPDGRAQALVSDLEQLRARGVLDVRAELAPGSDQSSRTAIVLELVGTDRPGIVRDISRALSELEVSIDDLQTSTRDAPMSGGVVFEARATLRAPAGISLDHVRAALEAIADELMVELVLSGEE